MISSAYQYGVSMRCGLFACFKTSSLVACLIAVFSATNFVFAQTPSDEVLRNKQGRFSDVASPTTKPVTTTAPLQAPGNAQQSMPVAPVSAAVAISAPTTYSVARSDRTLREALVKWARSSGWTFEPEHWAVPRDIPVAGGASVDTDFKTAVRMLLRSTELTDLPVQPCFYNANQTLRVVPINDSCTRGN